MGVMSKAEEKYLTVPLQASDKALMDICGLNTLRFEFIRPEVVIPDNHSAFYSCHNEKRPAW